jgi:hypothetical protein
MGHLGGVSACIYSSHTCSHTFAYTFILLLSPSCLGLTGLRLLSPNIWRPSCSKLENDPDNATQTNEPTSPSRQSTTQTSTQDLLPSQILSTIIKGSENPTFGDILEVEVLRQDNNAATIAVGSSQNVGGTSSMQINGGAPHQSPL